MLALAFTAAERAVAHPMVAPELFRRRGYSLAVGGAFGVAVLGSLLAAGDHVSLRPALLAVAVAYLLALGLTRAGGRADADRPAPV